MTNHPLTDEICEQIQDSIPKLRRDEHGHTFSHDGQRILDGMFEELSEVSNAEMRSAADWQLEQVIEWLRHNLGSVPLDPVGYSGHEIDVDYVIENLREDMRPRTQEDN